MENVSPAYDEQPRPPKTKHASDTVSQKNLSSHLPALHIPPMSDTALKRWCEARDAYLGQQYPYVQQQQEVKSKSKSTKHHDTASIATFESVRLSRMDRQRPSLTKQMSLQKTRIVHDHFDDKCVGTETYEPVFLKNSIEQTDQAVQVDLPSPLFELRHEYDSSMVDGEKKQQVEYREEPVDYCDKAIETDPVISFEPEIAVAEQTTGQSEIQPIPNVRALIFDEDDDTKTILSSTDSNVSLSDQMQRLRHRFKRLSKERRILSCLLLIYVLIMFGLLLVIFFLMWAFQGRALVLHREVPNTDTVPVHGVARYGESCKNNHDCSRPFTCYKHQRMSSSGICRCALNYTLVNNQCIGDLDAICTKDTDCQRYMLCSGMEDRTRRCHCQALYHYDFDRKQCRGEYDAPCRDNADCYANLICNRTMPSSLCSCQVNYRYHSLERKCRGDPGAVCEQATAECVENAECRDGACQCAFQFISDKHKICVDPCLKITPNPVRIRYPGNCRRFIDCQQRTKSECPEMTIFNFRTQLCDYPQNVLDCR